MIVIELWNLRINSFYTYTCFLSMKRFFYCSKILADSLSPWYYFTVFFLHTYNTQHLNCTTVLIVQSNISLQLWWSNSQSSIHDKNVRSWYFLGSEFQIDFHESFHRMFEFLTVAKIWLNDDTCNNLHSTSIVILILNDLILPVFSQGDLL